MPTDAEIDDENQALRQYEAETAQNYHASHGHCHDCGACSVTPCSHLKPAPKARPVPTQAFLDRAKFMTDDDAYDLWRDETR